MTPEPTSILILIRIRIRRFVSMCASIVRQTQTGEAAWLGHSR